MHWRNSLFGCTGNSLKKHGDCSGLWGADTSKSANSGRNSLLIPCITGNLRRDGFAADCALYHAECVENVGFSGRFLENSDN
jgi:hypothetical protein